MPTGTVATVRNLKKKKKKGKKRHYCLTKLPLYMNSEKVVGTVYKHCSDIAAFYIVIKYSN